MKCFVIDIAKCNGCYNCQIACKDEHVGNDWTPYAKPQPDTGHFWMKMNEKVRGTVPKVKMSYIATPCMHCSNAPCMESCTPGAIYRREDGMVIIDPEKCTGCVKCTDVCPYNAIYFNRDLNLAQKCTGCAHLLDRGWKEPRCVESCMTDALKFGEEEELKDLIKDAEVMLPEEKTQPRVYYKNLPRRFVAGTIYDPEMEECLEGVKVTLKDITPIPVKEKVIQCGAYCFRVNPRLEKEALHRAETDGFGDFWFNQIEPGVYSLKIEKDGYKTHSIDAVDITGEDVNLGDIGLTRG